MGPRPTRPRPRPRSRRRALAADRLRERLADLLLLADPALVRLMAARRLAPLDPLTPSSASAWAVPSSPTSRARTAPHPNWRSGSPSTRRPPGSACRLQRLFGDQLADPDARFEMQAALRATLG
ncbi:hypothetical protein NKH77_48480 [Streptomyces sp. M19]